MNRFSNILWVGNSDQHDEVSLKQAVALARRNQAQLTLAVCYDNIKQLSQDQPIHNVLIQDMLSHKNQQLETFVKPLTTGVKTTIKVMFGKPFIELIREVIQHKRDLLIKSVQRPHPLSQVFFGSLDYKLLRKCPCPVWLIGAEQNPTYQNIVVAIDHEPDNTENTELNEQLLSMAAALALSELATLHVVHAWYLPHESFLRSARAQNSEEEVNQWAADIEQQRRQWLAQITTKHSAQFDATTQQYLNTQLHLLHGEATDVIPELIGKLQADLLLLGTVGRSGVPGYIIGNTAESILNRVSCSVMAIKPSGFISPVQ